MINQTIKLFFLYFLTGGFFLTACGGDGGENGGIGDTTVPSLISQSPIAQLIPESSVITIVFDESMDTTNFTLSGDLAIESDGGVWSQTNEINDTLTITPGLPNNGNWFASPERNLSVEAQDLAGNAASMVNLDYDIYRGTLYYVDSSKTVDLSDGLSPATARRFIHTTVANVTVPATVLVNVGEYRLSHAASTHVELREGVSLYGGYNADFTQRDPATYITTIEDRSTSTSNLPIIPGTDILLGSAAVIGDGNNVPITSLTVIDGFTILGSTQGAHLTTALLLSNNSSPTLLNNTFDGGSGANRSSGIIAANNASPLVQGNTINGGSGIGSYGISNSYSSSPTLKNNTINGGGGGNASYGVRNFDNCSPLVQNNSINGGSGNNASVGIVNYENSAPTVQNNTINGGGGNNSYGLRNLTSSSPTIRGNVIHGGSGGFQSTGIYLSDFSSSEIHNNTIHGGNGGSNTFGIYNILNAAPILQNNTIHGGSGASFSMTIRNSESIPSLQNNILMTRAGIGSYCLYEAGTVESPQSLHNNVFYNCTILYYDNAVGCDLSTDCTTIEQVNALTNITNGSSGNVSDDPAFVDIDGLDADINTMADNDWRLNSSSPTSISAGGLNGIDQVWTFTADKDGVARPAAGLPWAIGAYEEK